MQPWQSQRTNSLEINERSPQSHSLLRDDMRYTMVFGQSDKSEFGRGKAGCCAPGFLYYTNRRSTQYRTGIVATDKTVEPRVRITAFSPSPPYWSAKAEARPATGMA